MGYLLAIIAVFLWSLNPIISNYFATSLAPLEIAFSRWLIASTILICITHKELWQNRQWFISHLKYLLSLAICGIVITNTLVYYAGHTASAINISLLNTLGPIFLLILSHFFLKKTISYKQIISIFFILLGVIIIIFKGNFSSISSVQLVPGDFIILINAFCFAVYSLLQSKRPSYISQTALLASSSILGVLVLFCLMIIIVPQHQLTNLKTIDYCLFVYLGIFNSIFAYLSWNTALHRLGSIKIAAIYYTLPLFSTTEAYFLLGERINLSQILGGFLVISSIIYANYCSPKDSKKGLH